MCKAFTFILICSRSPGRCLLSHTKRPAMWSGIPSQNWMHSTRMCLPQLTQPLWIREVWGGCLIQHPWYCCCYGITVLLKGRTAHFSTLPTQGLEPANLSLTGPMLLTGRLPAARYLQQIPDQLQRCGLRVRLRVFEEAILYQSVTYGPPGEDMVPIL
jgi:hypothetical protein